MDLVFAYVYARAASGGALASVAALQERVDSVRAFANTLNIFTGLESDPFSGSCDDYASLGIADEAELNTLSLFPTPATDVVRFTAPRELVGGLLSMRDATGRLVLQQRVMPETNTIKLEGLSNGVYICDAVTRNARFTGKLVKQ